MGNQVLCTIHFNDGTDLKLSWQQKEENASTIVSKVRSAIEKDKFYFESNGDLIIVPSQNIKYIHLTPGPQALPQDIVVRNVTIVD